MEWTKLLTKVIFHFQFHVFFHYKTHTLVSHSLKSPFYSFFDSKKSSEKKKVWAAMGVEFYESDATRTACFDLVWTRSNHPKPKLMLHFLSPSSLVELISSTLSHLSLLTNERVCQKSKLYAMVFETAYIKLVIIFDMILVGFKVFICLLQCL